VQIERQLLMKFTFRASLHPAQVQRTVEPIPLGIHASARKLKQIGGERFGLLLRFRLGVFDKALESVAVSRFHGVLIGVSRPGQ